MYFSQDKNQLFSVSNIRYSFPYLTKHVKSHQSDFTPPIVASNFSSGLASGLDVHDTSSLGRDYPLRAGMVVTIEPGLYLNGLDGDAATTTIPAHFRGIGIRIEDDVVVCESRQQQQQQQQQQQAAASSTHHEHRQHLHQPQQLQHFQPLQHQHYPHHHHQQQHQSHLRRSEPEVLTAAAPKSVRDIEAAMAEGEAYRAARSKRRAL
jgi:Xaa-Pro aminopeptidase